MSLASKTLFVTGASRGIGLAIALRAARDGANVAIAAKTAEPHPKLKGTIFTAAEPGNIRSAESAARLDSTDLPIPASGGSLGRENPAGTDRSRVARPAGRGKRPAAYRVLSS